MKSFYPTLFLCLIMSQVCIAAPKYWVGPQNGDWSNQANWSNTLNGSGGAGVPGALDSVVFSNAVTEVVHADQSTTISSMRINGNVTLYASSPVTLRISTSFFVYFLGSLKDSTSADVPFNLVINGSTKAYGYIYGGLSFEGGVPLSNADNTGATFTTEEGSKVTVISQADANTSNPGSSNNYDVFKPGQMVFGRNSGHINSTLSSLIFLYNCSYILENNPDAVIPIATWTADKYREPSYGGFIQAPASSIMIKGTIGKLKYLQPVFDCAKFVVDLPGLGSDFDLSIPDGSLIRGNLEIYNTNNHILTLLADGSNNTSVNVTLGTGQQRAGAAGNLVVTGNATKVTLARATAATASNSYKLLVSQSFVQSGGNFSLQDYNAATGTTSLLVRNDFTQTGGTFYTNSTSTEGKFILAMVTPPYITGPSGSFYSLRSISASSGTIDNAAHMVTLQINHGVYLNNGYESNPNGVSLTSPLTVGKLDLVLSPLTTSAINVLTVNNPSPDAITLGPPTTGPGGQIASTSYVNGPVRRATNSTSAYLFPTGKGNNFVPRPNATTFSALFHADSCYIIPSSGEPSLYQAEYYQAGYTDLSVTAPLSGVSNAEFWNIGRLSSADVPASVKLFINGEAVPGAAAADALVTAGYVNGRWAAQNGTILSPGNSTTGSVTSKPVSAPGLFTFGYGNPTALNPGNGNVFNGLNYKYYEGGYNLMPDFNSLVPLKTGNSANIDLGIRRSGVNDSFAIVWEGYINIPVAGSYTFETVSDDGSKLYFNSLYSSGASPLVNNDGTHPPQTVTGTINVSAAGRYPITITYFENYGGEGLQVYWSGPGIPRQQVPSSAFTDGATLPAASGLNYKYYEGSFNAVPDFSSLTPVKTGTSPNVDINVRPAGVNDNFAFKWDGTITIPSAGTYIFETVSDDGSKLYFNGNFLVSNDGLHAPTSATGTVTVAAGTYPISISYFEKDGGEAMQVYWSGPGITRQLIPDAAFGTGSATPPSVGNGLNYKYYEGDFNTLPDFSTLTPVKTGNSPNADISVRPTGVNDHFAFVWQGTINLPAAGTYTFETISDDGSKIYFNMPYSATANSLVDNDGLHGPTPATGTVTVPTAGSYPITITFFEKDGSETMQLYWTGPGIARQLIPDQAFGPANNIPGVDIRGLNYKYYEILTDYLPYFTYMNAIKTGITPNIDISVRPPDVNDHFAFWWEGYIDIPVAGTYTFETVSDDGSRVYFNSPYDVFGNGLVNNEGLHAPVSATGTINITTPGKYPIIVTYFEKDGGETMQLYWTGPGMPRQRVPDAAFTITNNAIGSAVMSGNQTINVMGDPNNSAVKVYPNPFVESFAVDYYNQGSDKNKVSIGLYDLNGKLVYNYQPANLVKGYNRWMLNTTAAKLASGVYMAQIKVNGIPFKTLKLIKTKK